MTKLAQASLILPVLSGISTAL